MDRAFYKFFARKVAYYLEWKGCEVVEKVERRYIKLKQVNEFILIPLFHTEFINIYYTYQGEIQDVFRSDKKYIKEAFLAFRKFHYKRNLKKALSNDDETKACI